MCCSVNGSVCLVCWHVGGTRGSGIMSSAAGVLWISVVRGMRGVYDMCMCLARDSVGGEELRG